MPDAEVMPRRHAKHCSNDQLQDQEVSSSGRFHESLNLAGAGKSIDILASPDDYYTCLQVMRYLAKFCLDVP